MRRIWLTLVVNRDTVPCQTSVHKLEKRSSCTRTEAERVIKGSFKAAVPSSSEDQQS